MAKYLGRQKIMERANYKSINSISALEDRDRGKPFGFPTRVKLGPNRVGWPDDEVEAWDRHKRAARLGEQFADIITPRLLPLSPEDVTTALGEAMRITGGMPPATEHAARELADQVITSLAGPEGAAT